MKSDRVVLAGIVFLGSISGCGDYATKTELNQLRAQYVATHDTMVAMWEATESTFNRFALDTVPRPKCNPRCLPLEPPRKEPSPIAP
jgi:hypothetical protein